MKTITVERVIGITTANFKVQLNGRQVLVPVSYIQGVCGNKLTFHSNKEAMSIFKLV